MTDLRVVQDDEGEEQPAESGFTVGDAAHSIAELAAEIHKRFKGWTPSDALKAVELALTQYLSTEQLKLAYGQPAVELPELPEVDVAQRLADLGVLEDDPEVQHETPTEEGY